jgi:hypothetical protein
LFGSGNIFGARDRACKCEDCQLVSATYGLPTERKLRWCAPCGGVHDAVDESGWQDQEKLKAMDEKAARVRKENGQQRRRQSSAGASLRRTRRIPCTRIKRQGGPNIIATRQNAECIKR